ncbi:MAG: ACT domain-containing protein [Nitrosopumilales archaeon]|nr:MAG: ACT domain-containing protein [Nitrosopumilales archaeon]
MQERFITFIAYIKYMYSQAFSVPHAVRQVIGSNTLFFQALSTGIANYTALAQKIKPEVEKLTKSEVNINTLVVAIKRFADSLEDNYEVHPILDGVRMTLTGSIIDIDFHESDDTYQVLDEIFELGGGYNMFRTNKQIRLFAEDIDEIRSMFKSSPKGVPGEIKDGLSKITITVQPDKENTYEVLSIVLSILHNNRIPLYNAFFTQNEIVLILGMDDAAKAYEVVREKLYSHD